KVQRALLQYREPRNRKLVMEGLESAGRRDLIGSGSRCLVRGTASATAGYFGKHPVRKKE
ncbi:MAG TPA: DUF3362 domain-containing protein, partial [Methanoregula sp.]|nr:DUF3362 domain-containing protein [Methanoregula sp.]